ncbi:MAG TPA: hypothetical protein VFR05_01655 [Terriglobia bacterium]|nr:hypothetical protein [Terriglobia bacterium]
MAGTYNSRKTENCLSSIQQSIEYRQQEGKVNSTDTVESTVRNRNYDIGLRIGAFRKVRLPHYPDQRFRSPYPFYKPDIVHFISLNEKAFHAQ